MILRKQEQGRSMVEMLGVLAIIGVLSVAGIAGYSMAMRNHRANEIANAASMLYIMGIAQNQGNGNGTLEYTTVAGQNPAGVTSMTYMGTTDKAVHITLNDEADCSIVADRLGGTCSGTSLTFSPWEKRETTAEIDFNNIDWSDLDGGDCTEQQVGKYVCVDDHIMLCKNGSIKTSWDYTYHMCYQGCQDHEIHDDLMIFY